MPAAAPPVRYSDDFIRRGSFLHGLRTLARRRRHERDPTFIVRFVTTEPLVALARLRFVELMACLAAASELAMGQDADHALQSCALAMRIGRGRGAAGSELRNVYYQSLLRFIGCNAETGVMAAIAGDVLELRRAMAPLDMAQAPRVVGALVQRVRATHADASALATAQAVLRSLSRAGEFARDIFPGHCEVAQRLGRRLGFDERFVAGLGQLYARWDGKGIPDGRRRAHPSCRAHRGAGAGTRPPPPARRLARPRRALLRERRGGQFEPALVDWALAQGPALLAGLPTRWEQLLELEPPPHDVLDRRRPRQALEVLADYADIQSGWLLTHTRRVAELAVDAARQLEMSPDAQRALRQAALLHDIGRVGVSTHVWDHPGPLGHSDLDRVRLHGTLHGADPAPRTGAGRPRRRRGAGLRGARAPRRQRLCARARRRRADAVAPRAGGGRRGGRARRDAGPIGRRTTTPASSASSARRCAAGRLDRAACRAVLAVLGARLAASAPRADAPAGLSERECEVLAELSKGRTNKEIARALGISPKTVGHQVQAIYRKAGVHTRAGATLFAMEQGLLGA